ncbi:MAG: TetR/AcrR family transcriptional regulator [Deltaproteobacteria bacterium]|nr:TetR/AcrR family transcriptional regulator [Deltaproteobacteria bacterium]
MPTTQRRKRAIARTREDILEAAARAFSRRGYHSATMRDIAREAGYTAASLYTYFKSKQEILGGLVALVTQEFLVKFDEALPAGMSFRQKLSLLVQRQLANADRRRDLYALLMTLRPGDVCLPRPRDRKRQSPFWHMEMQVVRFTEWLRENATTDDLGGHDPEVAARFMVAIGHGFLSYWVFARPAAEPVTRQASLILDLFLDGIRGAKVARTGGHDA